MKHLITALLFAIAMLPAAQAAPYCKVAGPQYVHTIQVDANWITYAWCTATDYQWTTTIPAQNTTARINDGVAYLFGVNPGFVNAPPYLPAGDPVMVKLIAAVESATAADAVRPPATPPAPPAPPPKKAGSWYVLKNGAYSDRPTYPATDGVRITKSNGRIAVDAPCDCVQPIIEGKTTYCATEEPGINISTVAVCTKYTP